MVFRKFVVDSFGEPYIREKPWRSGTSFRQLIVYTFVLVGITCSFALTVMPWLMIDKRWAL